tara:strand:+ start:735 stop:887 length:153 start_codon:yes stop_codon:yes gene_type:complete
MAVSFHSAIQGRRKNARTPGALPLTMVDRSSDGAEETKIPAGDAARETAT